ncbi:MAG: hypothetical protein KJ066_23070 [Acidobacteria bacterium]|nr:hypothetical protein [Acidobacteriota bacterium]
MRDGSPRRPTASPRSTTWTPAGVQIVDWRRHGRLDALRALAERAGGLMWSRRLLHALLDELHLGDDFEALVGRVARLPASHNARLLAIALLVRHSWCPRDLSRTATRIGLPHPKAPTAAALTPTSQTPRDRGHRRRASQPAPRPRSRAR